LCYTAIINVDGWIVYQPLGVAMQKDMILFIESVPEEMALLEQTFESDERFTYLFVGSSSDLSNVMKNNPIDVIVASVKQSEGSINSILVSYPNIPIIILSEVNDLSEAISIMKHGAVEIIIRDSSNNYLLNLPTACYEAICKKKSQIHTNNLYQAVVQNPNLIVITNPQGMIEYANQKLIETTGYTLEELVGYRTNIFKSGHHDDSFYKNIWETIRFGNKWTGEINNRTKAGKFYWELASIAPIRNSAGSITHYIKVSENITKIKTEESERMQSEKASTAINIAGGISHELNQPLQIILGKTELLVEKFRDDENTSKHLQTIIKNVTRILDISKRLKDITDYKTIEYLNSTIFDINQQNDTPDS
jgi:PAS domain S-box-containing protein